MSEPRPSASITLLRRGGAHKDRGLEILMVKRTAAARVMPGFWVFPGGAVDPEDGDPKSDHARRACAVRELNEEAGIELSPDADLVPFTRWITPEWLPTRFDAYFFLALAPRHSPPVPDGEEITEAGWFEAGRVLEAHRAGEMMLAFPTIRQLEELAQFRTADEVLSEFRRRPRQPVMPVMVETDQGPKLTLPGEPGYPG